MHGTNHIFIFFWDDVTMFQKGQIFFPADDVYVLSLESSMQGIEWDIYQTREERGSCIAEQILCCRIGRHG